jgi:hypothetical protein
MASDNVRQSAYNLLALSATVFAASAFDVEAESRFIASNLRLSRHAEQFSDHAEGPGISCRIASRRFPIVTGRSLSGQSARCREGSACRVFRGLIE